jgi:hypothetical protein
MPMIRVAFAALYGRDLKQGVFCRVNVKIAGMPLFDLNAAMLAATALP